MQNVMAMWRDLDDVSVFTGVVKLPGVGDGDAPRLKKLDDADGPLDGPGHIMHPNEFLSQMALYDGSETRRVQVEVDACLFANKERDLTPVDWNTLDKYMDQLGNPGFPALHFFPHEHTAVRADDVIMLKVKGKGHDPGGAEVPAFERFWAHVVSVAPHGVVTAVPTTNLLWADVSASKPISVPLGAIIASRHGAYWSEE